MERVRTAPGGPERTARALFEAGVDLLGGSPEQRLETKVLLLRAARLSEAEFLAFPETPVSARAEERFGRWLSLRRSGVPLAYVTGGREFWSLPFRVTPSVLIPRPETEMLVERVLALVRSGREAICDVGTGCGNIAVSLARELPHASVWATDISRRALAVAAGNAARLGVPGIVFLRSNLLAEPRRRGLRFDVIVSNPPYVSLGEWAALPAEIRAHEPGRALLAGESGLDIFRRLIRQAPRCLRPEGYLILEIGDGQQPAVLDMFGPRWTEVETGWDLRGCPRVITARLLA